MDRSEEDEASIGGLAAGLGIAVGEGVSDPRKAGKTQGEYFVRETARLYSSLPWHQLRGRYGKSLPSRGCFDRYGRDEKSIAIADSRNH